MRHLKKIQVSMSLVAAILIVLHLAYPDLKIDAITVSLVVMLVTPWLLPLLKSIESPGGWKIELELNELTHNAREADLISNDHQRTTSNYEFLNETRSDPTAALVLLRVELEKILRKLALQNGLEAKYGVSLLTRELRKREIISPEEASVLADMAGTLNRAVHSEEISKGTTEWVINIAPQILDSIKGKLKLEN